jgi:hypothetical protein
MEILQVSNLDDRHNARRRPIDPEPTGEAIAAAFIIGVLCGLVALTIAVSVFVYFEGGLLCFSSDGISCLKERAPP